MGVRLYTGGRLAQYKKYDESSCEKSGGEDCYVPGTPRASEGERNTGGQNPPAEKKSS